MSKLVFQIKNFFKKRKWEIYEKNCDVNFLQYKFIGVLSLEYSTNKLPFKYRAWLFSELKPYTEISLDELLMDDDFNKLITKLRRKEKLERIKYEN